METEKMIAEIIEHIKKHDNHDFFNDDAGDLLGIIKFYYYGILDWCGCGDPRTAIRTVKELLYALSDFTKREQRLMESFEIKSVYDDPLVLCLAYTLDSARLTEHGSSIGGAWLTEDGEYFLWAINEAEKENELDLF